MLDDILNTYLESEKAICKYFDLIFDDNNDSFCWSGVHKIIYFETYSIKQYTNYYWMIKEGDIIANPIIEELLNEYGLIFAEIKHIERKDKFTMICIDNNYNGNFTFCIFKNENKIEIEDLENKNSIS